jgi:hypothetical protein
VTNLRWLSRLSWFGGQRSVASGMPPEAIATLERLPPGRELAAGVRQSRAARDARAPQRRYRRVKASRALELAEHLGDIEVRRTR